MAGQTGPIMRCHAAGLNIGLTTIALLIPWLTLSTAVSFASDSAVRLRIAWGSGDAAKHRWFGSFQYSGGTLTELQPLGIESDAPAAVRLYNNEVVIEPLERRGFDGCDVTLEGDLAGSLVISIRTDQVSEPTILKIPVSEILQGQVKEKIDTLGSFLIAYRAPGDRLRLILDRDNLIFDPGEVWKLQVRCDLTDLPTSERLSLNASLYSKESKAVVWQATQELAPDNSRDQLRTFNVVCPISGGTYQLSLSVCREEGIASKLVPGQQDKSLLSRQVDIAVFDPATAAEILSDNWVSIVAIDPANPSWWKRLPNWVQLMRASGKPSGTFGNVDVRDISSVSHPCVELPRATEKNNPSWQCYCLPVQDVGVPHLVEISFPANVQQELEIAIVEPNATGRVSQAVSSGVYVDRLGSSPELDWQKRRICFWPRTETPQLLIVNRSLDLPGTYGSIELKRNYTLAPNFSPEVNSKDSANLVGVYLARPHLAMNVGATEELDAASEMSVETWLTFLQASHRTVQSARLAGYNTLVASVAADGSALYPSNLLLPSPRYDTGILAGGGQDPLRKDMLALLLRECDAQRIRFIPAIQLSLPIPILENSRRECDPRKSGITLICANGSELRGVSNATGLPLFGYNPLNAKAQDAMLGLAVELIERCVQHSSFAGIAVQIEGTGYGALPGIDCGFDDNTVGNFLEDTKINLPSEAINSLSERSDYLLNSSRKEWTQWRATQISQFYFRLAEELHRHKPDALLLLLTDRYYSTPRARQALLQAASTGGMSDWDLENGLDFSALMHIPGMRISNPTFVAPSDKLKQRPSVLVINETSERGDLLPRGTPQVELAFYESQNQDIDAYYPLSHGGAGSTRLVLANQPLPPDSWRNHSFASHVGTSNAVAVLEGGDYQPLILDTIHRQGLRALQEIPSGLVESRPLEKQPVIVRTLRTPTETYMIAENLCPWTVNASLELSSSNSIFWTELGIVEEENSTEKEVIQGELPYGQQDWPFRITSYGIRVWRFDTGNLKMDRLKVDLSPFALTQLAEQVASLQSKAANLNITREYPQLQNPGFELQEGVGRIFGWQLQRGTSGNARIESSTVLSGQRALRVESSDGNGAIVQSHLFPAPDTGMLILRARFCLLNADEQSQVLMSLVSEDDGRTYGSEKVLTPADLSRDRWSTHELVVRDLPLLQALQLRVQFKSVGQIGVLLDDVELHDLRFDERQRGEIVKRVYAAKMALDEMQVVDCLRLLNGYWPRFLAEHVPGAESLTESPAEVDDKTESPLTNEQPRIGRSMRSWIPKLWR